MATIKKVETTGMTREEAVKQAKLSCIMAGGNYRIQDGLEVGKKAGFWYDRFLGTEISQEDGLAMTPVDEAEVERLMRG
jgi:hypothetical protein